MYNTDTENFLRFSLSHGFQAKAFGALKVDLLAGIGPMLGVAFCMIILALLLIAIVLLLVLNAKKRGITLMNVLIWFQARSAYPLT